MDMETESRKRGMETLTVAVADYAKTLDKRSTQDRQISAISMLAKALSMHGRYHGDHNAYGMTLAKIGEVEDAVQKHQAAFASNVRNGLLLECSSLVESMKEYSALKRKLENRRLDYDAKQNKLSKSKKEKPALESEVVSAQTKYNETMADLQILMTSYAEREELLLEHLVEFAKAQYDFFASGLREMEDLHTFLTGDSLAGQLQANAALIQRHQEEDRGQAISTAEDSYSNNNSSANTFSTKSSDSLQSARNAHGGPQPNIGSAPLAVGGPSMPVAVVPRNVSMESMAAPKNSPSKKTSADTSPHVDEKVAPDDGNEYVEALYTFEASGLGEMSISKGEIVRVLRKIDDGWWVGECPGRRSGMFPSNYVRAIPSSKDTSRLSDSASKMSLSAQKSESAKTSGPRMILPEDSPHAPSTVAPCKECGCHEFSQNVFKVGHCNNCFHRH